jgi:hypothetical protein
MTATTKQEAIESTAKFVLEHLTMPQAEGLLDEVARQTGWAIGLAVDKGLTLEEIEQGVREGIRRKEQAG